MTCFTTTRKQKTIGINKLEEKKIHNKRVAQSQHNIFVYYHRRKITIGENTLDENNWVERVT